MVSHNHSMDMSHTHCIELELSIYVSIFLRKIPSQFSIPSVPTPETSGDDEDDEDEVEHQPAEAQIPTPNTGDDEDEVEHQPAEAQDSQFPLQTL